MWTFPKCCGCIQKTGGHPDTCNTLVLWSLLTAPNPQLQMPNEVVIQYRKKRKRWDKQSLIDCAYGTLVSANCCCMPIGNRISDMAPWCPFENALTLQRALVCVCGGERLASVNVLFPLRLHETVSEHWNTCGPEWYNNNFVSPGNCVFPDSGNTRLRLERESLNWENKHLLFHTCTLFFLFYT